MSLTISRLVGSSLTPGSYCRYIVEENKRNEKQQVKNLSTDHKHPLVNGTLINGQIIKFVEVPLRAPNGDVLATNIRIWVNLRLIFS